MSFVLDQSNIAGLPDGTPYLQVDIADDGTDIRFTVSLLPALLSIAGSNFGIQAFGFNVLNLATSTDIDGLPTGWSAGDDAQLDGFGEFDVAVFGTGSNRQSPTLTFFITGVDGDTPSTYATLSDPTAGEGNQFFAAHVAGFDQSVGDESAWFGGTTVVPLPASLWLLVSALGGLGLARRTLFARRSAPPVS